MSKCTDPGLCSISDLQELSEFVAGGGAAGYSDTFTELFGQTEARLLRSTPQRSIVPGNRAVVVFRNKDLLELAANPVIGMLPAEYHRFPRFFRNMIFATNPPIHGPMRQVFARPLAPKQLPPFNELARRIVADLVDELIGQGEIDFYTHFIERYTARFWGTLFEMTDEEVERLSESVRPINAATLVGSTPEEFDRLDDVFDKYVELVANAVDRALERGGNALLEAMSVLFTPVEGEGKPERVSDVIAANAIEGVHTVALACTNVLYQLLISPSELAAVRADLSLAPNAVAEGLRLWPPFILLDRFALRDLEFAGILIPRCTVLTMLWGAGNRDPQAFEHPNRYNIFRKQRRDTTFGGGVHICPGRYVARMMAQVMLEGVLAPNVRIELSGDRPTWLDTWGTRQLGKIYVTIERC